MGVFINNDKSIKLGDGIIYDIDELKWLSYEVNVAIVHVDKRRTVPAELYEGAIGRFPEHFYYDDGTDDIYGWIDHYIFQWNSDGYYMHACYVLGDGYIKLIHRADQGKSKDTYIVWDVDVGGVDKSISKITKAREVNDLVIDDEVDHLVNLDDIGELSDIEYVDHLDHRVEVPRSTIDQSMIHTIDKVKSSCSDDIDEAIDEDDVDHIARLDNVRHQHRLARVSSRDRGKSMYKVDRVANVNEIPKINHQQSHLIAEDVSIKVDMDPIRDKVDG